MSWASDEFPRIRARLMAAAMQPIERLAAEATIEILELNSWLEDDLRCQMDHGHSVPCTFTVTHRLFSCKPTAFMCVEAAAAKQAEIDDTAARCVCKRMCADHWRVTPA